MNAIAGFLVLAGVLAFLAGVWLAWLWVWRRYVRRPR